MNHPDAVPSPALTSINSVFIIGAGTMGSEIGAQCAMHGVRVLLYDSSPAATARAMERIRTIVKSDQAALQRVELANDLRRTNEADLIIECVPENLALKQGLFRELSAHCRPETILATNTSSLIPSQFAPSCRHPEKLAAFHFHLPVATSNIVDVMPHPGTAPAVVESLEAFARKIGQIPIRYDREHHGYIFNSIFGAMQRQALDLVINDIATFENVDRAWMGIFKMPVGPFGMFDGIGLDTIEIISHHWAEVLNDDAGRKRVAFLRKWTSQGWTGTKAGRGFYSYPEPAYARNDFLA